MAAAIVERVIDAQRAATLSALFLAFLALASPAAGAPPTGSFEVPFTTGPRGHLIADVHLNDAGPFPFALDTGAGRTIVNRARLGLLGLVERSTGEIAHGAHETFDLGLADVASLELGDVTLDSLELAVMELSHIESPDMPLFGVLGHDVFGRWDLLIDLGAERVTFHPRADTESDCAVCSGDIVIPFELNNGTHVQFEVVISDQSVTAVLDTGSGRSGMNSLAAKAIGVELPPVRPGTHAPALQVGELRLGDGVLARNVIVGVVDLPVFEQLGISEGPAILLGTGALAGKRLGIAYGLERMSVSSSVAPRR